ncbi:MAG: TRAP transporter small permease [Gemmatimonadetes bacterium]|nr:TRAP transporter small permease [Gemmatimonadota bacterium]
MSASTPDRRRLASAAQHGRIINVIARVHAGVAVLLFAVLTAIVGLQVLTRFVLHVAFIGSEEAARFVFFWVVMLGAAQSVRTRRHFTLDILMPGERLNGRIARFVLGLLPDACVLGMSIVLLVQGIDYSRAGLLRTATNTGINMALVYAAIPVFAALAGLYSVTRLIAEGRDLLAGGGAVPGGEHRPRAPGE